MTKSPDHDDDGLPLPDPETLQKFRAEARANMPTRGEWADMIALIRWQAKLEREGIANPNLPDGMTAIERSLRVILGLFLNRHDLMQSSAIAPLVRLHAAIVDLEYGRVSPLFKPKRRAAGNPGKGELFAVIQGLAARALSELIEGGEDARKAARRVAAALNMAGVTAETLINWRERLMQGEGPGAPWCAVWQFKQPLPTEWGNAKMRGETLLKILKERAGAIG